MQFIISLLLLTIICENNAEKRIMGGQMAVKAIPYQVSIRRYGRHICGGSIIDNMTILSAAHCFLFNSQPDHYKIVVGTRHLNYGGDEYSIAALLFKDFNPESFANDIAILKTKTPIEFNAKVQPIEIFNGTVPDKSELLVSGWGTTDYPNDEMSEHLKMLSVYSINNLFCMHLYDRFKVLVTPSEICTISRITNGVCNGDSGGPLVYNDALVGVTSRGVQCALGMPDIFTGVYVYLDWINSNRNNTE